MLGFIGGTGAMGQGLALRFAIAGENCIIGSRNMERAEQIATDLRERVPSVTADICGGDNQECARRADILFITMPFEAQKDSLSVLKKILTGKIVVSVSVPLIVAEGRGAVAVGVAEGSAALQAQAILQHSVIVSAFENLSAHELLIPNKNLDCDVIVCADELDAKQKIMELAKKIKSVRAIDGGGLNNSTYVENLTCLLVNINRRYKVHSSIKITGLEE